MALDNMNVHAMKTAWTGEVYTCKIAGTKDRGRDLLVTGKPHYKTMQYQDGNYVMPQYGVTKDEQKNVKEAKSIAKKDVQRLIKLGGLWLCSA